MHLPEGHTQAGATSALRAEALAGASLRGWVVQRSGLYAQGAEQAERAMTRTRGSHALGPLLPPGARGREGWGGDHRINLCCSLGESGSF